MAGRHGASRAVQARLSLACVSPRSCTASCHQPAPRSTNIQLLKPRYGGLPPYYCHHACGHVGYSTCSYVDRHRWCDGVQPAGAQGPGARAPGRDSMSSASEARPQSVKGHLSAANGTCLRLCNGPDNSGRRAGFALSRLAAALAAAPTVDTMRGSRRRQRDAASDPPPEGDPLSPAHAPDDQVCHCPASVLRSRDRARPWWC